MSTKFTSTYISVALVVLNKRNIKSFIFLIKQTKPRIFISYLQLESIQIVNARRWRQKGAKRRSGELDEQLGAAGNGGRHTLTATAEL